MTDIKNTPDNGVGVLQTFSQSEPEGAETTTEWSRPVELLCVGLGDAAALGHTGPE